jgi:hypothetical protein
MISLPANEVRSRQHENAQADQVEESLRGHSGISAQTIVPLDRHKIEPVIVEEFVGMSICVHAILP